MSPLLHPAAIRARQDAIRELLSVTDNRLYDEGVIELVRVVQQSAMPLATLNVSATGITSVAAKALAKLLTGEGCAVRLPLKHLDLSHNQVDADGFAALGIAMRHEHCQLEQVQLTENESIAVQEV